MLEKCLWFSQKRRKRKANTEEGKSAVQNEIVMGERRLSRKGEKVRRNGTFRRGVLSRRGGEGPVFVYHKERRYHLEKK